MGITLEGIERVLQRFEILEQRLNSPQELFERSAEIMSESARLTFDAEGRPGWDTRNDNKPHPILDLTGRLRDSVESTIGGGDSIVRMDSTSLEFGTEVEYGKYHQSDATRTKLPRRPFLLFQPEDVQDITDHFHQFLSWQTT